jgi:prepilin-type N-terminal cleavage/methylation domain-containing protein
MNMENRNFVNRASQGGFSLIELMIVLALGAVILFAAIGNYGSTNSQAQTDAEVRALNTLIPLVKQTFGSAQGNYTGLSNAIMLRAANFPDTMKSPLGTPNIRHSWEDDGIDLDANGTNDEFFTITYKDVPTGSCQDVLTRVYKFFIEVTVGGVTVTNIGEISDECAKGPAPIVMRTR